MPEERKVVRTKTYTIERIDYDDLTSELNRTNKGFSLMELLGLVTLVQQHLIACFSEIENQSLPKEVNIKSDGATVLDMDEHEINESKQ